MPETTNFNIPFLDGTELVRDYPTFSEDLANAVDAGLGSAGKILQVVRATDSTGRVTSSTSFVDASLSVSITPTSASNSIYVVSNVLASTVDADGSTSEAFLQITDSSDVALSGAERGILAIGVSGATFVRADSNFQLIGIDSPASTSAQTYKLRFSARSGTVTTLKNNLNTAQLLAIEVAA